MFTPTMKFRLFERFSNDALEVVETMEVNGKRVFGFDDPIVYRRVKGRLKLLRLVRHRAEPESECGLGGERDLGDDRRR